MILFPHAEIYCEVIHFIDLTVKNNQEPFFKQQEKGLMIIAKVNKRISIILVKICLLMTLIQESYMLFFLSSKAIALHPNDAQFLSGDYASHG